ncbi:cytochrome P450 [Microbulbifer sp. CNSA002]|uniref:cytochrome P450 n=1 Tax=Microbulbifer sp. CNSA002 TaxID=3373604 RepID=UPI0039B55691
MTPRKMHNKYPSSLFLGIDALYHIKKDALSYYKSLQSAYGDTVRVRLGPYRCWFLFHPDHIENTLATEANSFIRFERIMKILRQWNGNSLLIAEGKSWKDRRRKVLPSFAQQRIPSYAESVSKFANEFTKTVMSNSGLTDNYKCNIDAEMAKLSLDIACKNLFSKDLDSISVPISEAVDCLSEIAYNETTSHFTLPNFFPTSGNKKKKEVVKLMKTFISGIVSDRIEQNSNERSDLLSTLITHHNGDRTAIEEDVTSLLIAGHETSGATLSWLFLLLSQHQNIQKKVQNEIDRALGEAPVSYESLKKLPYLNAVIQETLRLHPPAYALFCRRAIKDVDVGGVLVKKGELVQLLPYVTQRDSRWFENSDCFYPERFINDKSWPKYAYFPFGAGPRICIGQSFGMMEVALTAATVLQKLSLSTAETSINGIPRFSLRPEKDITISFSSRYLAKLTTPLT